MRYIDHTYYIDNTHWHGSWIEGNYEVPITEMEEHAKRYAGGGYDSSEWSQFDHVKPKGWPTNLPCWDDARDEYEITSFEGAIADRENANRDREIYKEGFQAGLAAARPKATMPDRPLDETP